MRPHPKCGRASFPPFPPFASLALARTRTLSGAVRRRVPHVATGERVVLIAGVRLTLPPPPPLGTEERIVLIVDVWHPDLKTSEQQHVTGR